MRLSVTFQWRIQDFPQVGVPTLQEGRQHTILPKFPENCMKLKEFGPRGGRGCVSLVPLRSATAKVNLKIKVMSVAIIGGSKGPFSVQFL